MLVLLIFDRFIFSLDQCTSVLNLGAEVGCVITEGPWLLVGMPNLVKVSSDCDRS